MTTVDTDRQDDLFESQIIPPSLAITSMRDSGYKNTAYALAELIDNSQQAGASMIELFCLQTREVIRQRERSRLSKIAVLDDGRGMDYDKLRIALQFGNGSYLQDRSGIGRFGMGLPNASISQASRVEVWSWQNGPDNALYTYIDVPEIEAGEMDVVPNPEHSPVPDEWRELSEHFSKSGTIVVWSDLDVRRLTWKTARSTLSNTERLVGRVYRRFIIDDMLRIRLVEKDELGGIVRDREATFDDPLYLTPSPNVPPPFDEEAMFEHAFDEDYKIGVGNETHTVKVRYSVARAKTVELAPGSRNRGDTPYGRHARRNIGVSVVRAGRELTLDQGWCIGYDPRERWWGAEVEFPPALDEVFGVTMDKQAATHFAELANLDWRELAEEGEDFRETIERLKDEGDTRGLLLPLQDSIVRNLRRLRDIIESQGAKRRSTRRKRHGDAEADEPTRSTDRRWKKRSEERPIAGENRPRTDEDYDEIEKDLIERKRYPKSDAAELVQLIRDADLQVVFLEADFTNAYELFNVEIKGNLTEVTFNRKHPAFPATFGTVNTVDEDVNSLEAEDVLDRLTKAVNASKVLFAAWARYEREAGVERATQLERVRFAWGQIAANFLDPDSDDAFDLNL